jgi:hypothetical protein
MTTTPEETPAIPAELAAELEQQLRDLLALRRLSIDLLFAVKRGEYDRGLGLRDRVSKDAHDTLRLTGGLTVSAPSGDALRRRTRAAPRSRRAPAPDDEREV